MLLFAFNFNTHQSFTNLLIPVPANADYTVKFCSDDEQYGGCAETGQNQEVQITHIKENAT